MDNVYKGITAVNKMFNLNCIGRSRKPREVYYRQLIMYVMRESGYNLSEIARTFNRDHTTVIYALNKLKNVTGIEPIESDLKIIRELMNLKTIGTGEFFKNSKWRRVFREKGYKCEIPGCGFNEVLEIHHENPLMGDEINNLMVLCPNHHSMLHKEMLYIKGVSLKDESNG